MATKIGGVEIYLEKLQTIKLSKALHLYYQSAYDYQTWEDDNLPWWAPTHKVTLLFDHVILQDHVIK